MHVYLILALALQPCPSEPSPDSLSPLEGRVQAGIFDRPGPSASGAPVPLLALATVTEYPTTPNTLVACVAMSDSIIKVWIAGVRRVGALNMVGPATADLPLPFTRPGRYKLVVAYRRHQQTLTVLISSESLSLVGDGPLVAVIPRRTARLQPHSVYVRCGPGRQPMATCDSIAQELQDTCGLRPIVLPANLTAPWVHPFGAEHPWPSAREDYFSYSDSARLALLPKYLAARSKPYWHAHSSAFTLDYWTWLGDGGTCYDGTCHPYP